jgi:hypothetical protein
VDLDEAAKRTFFAEELPRYWRTLPLAGRLGLRMLFSIAAPDVLSDSSRAAARSPVFAMKAH